MIRCIPMGICSWNFRLAGDGHQGQATFDWMTEQGAIRADSIAYHIRKHGVFSGLWTLERGVEVVAEARKPSAMFRSFEIRDAHGPALLSAASIVTRSYRLSSGARMIASINPDHAFTRRATITVPATDHPFSTIVFSFWLAVMTWRRTSRNSSS